LLLATTLKISKCVTADGYVGLSVIVICRVLQRAVFFCIFFHVVGQLPSQNVTLNKDPNTKVEPKV